jgi:ATP-dependent protease ClpP protease subunit
MALPLLLLNATNYLAVHGPITAASADAFVQQALVQPQALFVYLDTGGGSIEDGLRMVQLLHQRPYRCIAQRAHSMGFALLQACKYRWVLPAASLMQHQPWVHLEGELPHLQARLAYVAQLEQQLVQLQAVRLGLAAEDFRHRTSHEWWLTGQMAVAQGAADAIVAVACTPHLTACPLFSPTSEASDNIASRKSRPG